MMIIIMMRGDRELGPVHCESYATKAIDVKTFFYVF